MTIEEAEARTAREMLSVLVLGTALLLNAGCGREAPKAPEKGPIDVTVLTVAARGRAGHRRLRRADAKLAGRQHPGARVRAGSTSACTPKARSSRRARCCSRWTRSRSRRRSTRQAAALQRSRRRCEVAKQNLDAHQAARRSRTRCRRRTSTTRRASTSRRRPRSQQAQGAARGRRSSTSRTRRSARRSTACRATRGGRRHVPQPAERAAHDGLGADADVDQLQHLGERDGAHPQRRAQRPAQAARRRQVHRRGGDGRRQPLPVHRRDHVRGPVVQPARRARSCCARRSNNPAGRAAAQPVRARAPDGRDPAERDRGSAARRAAEREGPLRLGREQATEQGRAAPGHGRRMEGRRLVHLRRASPTATRSSSTAACGSRRARP